MQMLKAKLYMLRQEEQAAKAAGIRGDVKDNGWGARSALMSFSLILW